MKIKLFNRDGADLYIEKSEQQVEPNIYVWNLKVDKKHEYCLEYMRCIGNYPNDIEAVDPSGGPFIAVGDMIRKYQIIKIVDCTTFWLSERNNN